MMLDDPLLKVSEVAHMMRVSTMTVYRLIYEGELGALRIGGSWRIRVSEVESYLRMAAEMEAQG